MTLMIYVLPVPPLALNRMSCSHLVQLILLLFYILVVLSLMWEIE